MSATIQKLVTFTPQLYSNAEAKAKQLGVSFAEYIRHLIINDVEEDVTTFPMVDADTNRRIGESLQAYKEGRYSEVDPTNDDQLNELVGLK